MIKRTAASIPPVGTDSAGTAEAGHSAWMGKESNAADRAGPAVKAPNLIALNKEPLKAATTGASRHVDEEEETRELS